MLLFVLRNSAAPGFNVVADTYIQYSSTLLEKIRQVSQRVTDQTKASVPNLAREGRRSVQAELGNKE